MDVTNTVLLEPDYGYNTDPSVLTAIGSLLNRVDEIESYLEEGCFKCNCSTRFFVFE